MDQTKQRAGQVLDLFSGIGGFSLGLERSGFQTAAFCEIDPYCRAVLAGHWPAVPCFSDVRRLHATNLVGRIDVICGGFPCQDLSYAGEGAGIEGARSGLWGEFFRLIGELRPRFVIVENVAALLSRGMARVVGDLAGIGYGAQWSVVSACSVGAPHLRRRVFIVAYPDSIDGWEGVRDSLARTFRSIQADDGTPRARARYRARLANPSELYRGADGLPFGLERTQGLGNAIIPDIAELIGLALRDAGREAMSDRDRLRIPGAKSAMGAAAPPENKSAPSVKS